MRPNLSNMEKRLRIVQHLFGEPLEPDILDGYLEDDALRREYDALCEAKRSLDAREAQCPDPEILARVIEAAGRRQLRVINGGRARWRPQRLRLVYALSAAAVILVALTVGLFRVLLPGAEIASLDAPVEQGEEIVSLDVLVEQGEESVATAAQVEDSLPVAGPEQISTLPEPAWNEAENLVDVHSRLNLIRARSHAQLWDESAVISLDSIPMDASDLLPGLGAASTRRDQ